MVSDAALGSHYQMQPLAATIETPLCLVVLEWLAPSKDEEACFQGEEGGKKIHSKGAASGGSGSFWQVIPAEVFLTGSMTLVNKWGWGKAQEAGTHFLADMIVLYRQPC